MKNILFTILALVAFATVSFAQGPAKRTVQNTGPVDLFTPDAQYFSAVDVGTGKLTKTYTVGKGQTAFYINCYSADNTIPATVKLALNGSTTHKVLLGLGTFGPMGINNTGAGTATSTLTFTGYTTAEAKHITCEVWGQ